MKKVGSRRSELGCGSYGRGGRSYSSIQRGLMYTPSKLTFLSFGLFAFSACGDDEPKTTQGPGASLKCASSGKNAFDTYGATAFVAVNKAIFAEVTAELQANGSANIGNSFAGVADFPRFEGRLAAFLVFAYGGPTSITYTDGKQYNGVQDMREAHAGMGITNAQYDYFVANIIVPALSKSGVPMGDISSCFAPLVVDASVKASIVGQ